MASGKARDGFTLCNVQLGVGAGVHACGGKREIIRGPVSFRIVWTRKFGWELEVCTYARKGDEHVEARNPSVWNRVENYVPLDKGAINMLIEAFQKMIEGLKTLERKRFRGA